MSYQGNIVIVDQGKTIDGETLQQLLAKYKTCVGVAACDGENGIVIMPAHSKTHDMEDVVKQTTEILGESTPIVMHFLDYPDGEVHENDVQPFVILHGIKGADLVAFLEGEFPGYNKPESAHSDAYHAFEDYLKDEIQRIHINEGKGDIDKTLAILEGAAFRKNLRNLMIPRGAIVLLCSNGKILQFQKNDEELKTDWGWISNSGAIDEEENGEEDKKEQEAPVETPKLSRMALLQQKLRLKSEPGRAAEKVVVETPKDDDTTDGKDDEALHEKAETATRIPATNAELLKQDAPPPENVPVPARLSGRARKKWIKRHFNVFPSDWESVSELPYQSLRPNSDLRAQKSFAGLKEKLQEGPAVRVDALPVIPPKELEQLLNKFLPSTKGTDPAKIVDIEKESDSFFERTDKSLEDVVLWDSDTRFRLCNEHPYAAAVLLGNCFQRILQDNPDMLKKLVAPPKEEKMSRMAQLQAKLADKRAM